MVAARGKLVLHAAISWEFQTATILQLFVFSNMQFSERVRIYGDLISFGRVNIAVDKCKVNMIRSRGCSASRSPC